MVKVDSKGRIVLPQAVRERLDLTPGTEVAVHQEAGRVVVEPEDDPGGIIERLERLVAETASEREATTPPEVGVDPLAQRHREAVRRRAEQTGDE